MTRYGWRDPIRWLMALSMLLVGGLAATWLVNSFQNERDHLTKELDFFFSGVVRELEDSLLQENFMLREESSDSIVMEQKLKIQGAPSDSVHVLAFLGDDNTTRKIHQRRMRSFHRRHENRPEHAFAGALSLHMQMSKTDSLGLRLGVDGDLPDPLSLIRRKFHEAYAGTNFNFPVEVVELLGDEDEPRGTIFSRAYFDVASGRSYTVLASGHRPYLLSRLTNEFLFTLLLLAVTFLAFFFTYRGLVHHRKLNILKNDLISNITHELKTPISTVGVALEALSDFQAGDDPVKAKEYLEISKKELRRLSLLVDNVLKNSVQEGKAIHLHLETINARDLIDEILKIMKVHFDKVSARVDFKYSGDDFKLEGDRLHLTSVVYNILDNALKYTGDDPVIEINLRQENGQIHLAISDNGLGISRQHHSKIFDKFFRISKGDRHNVKGHGLGLSYVRQVVVQHQGEINVMSKLGSGSTFTIKLPKKQLT
ncbi:MAG: HAMP domain-containing histidine kinase [Saprospiraceae bacterium]|nr:HAMP domain-containing histidine kinase [Saprospiraceae bacterium]